MLCMSPSQVAFFSSKACISPIMALARKGKKDFPLTQIVLKHISSSMHTILEVHYRRDATFSDASFWLLLSALTASLGCLS